MAKTREAARRRRVDPPSDAPQGRGRASTAGTGPGRRAPADRRGQILQIAAKRFAEFGYEATTIRQIADDAQILSGSIYHHFDTKDEILDEIIRDAVDFLSENSQRIARSDADAEIRLTALILLALGELTKDQEAHSILYNERKFLRRSPHFEYVAKAKAANYNAWELVLGDGVKSGAFKASVDIFLTISTVIRMLNTCADWFKHDGAYEIEKIRTYRLEEVIDFNLDLILRALRSEARIGEPIPRAAALRLIEQIV